MTFRILSRICEVTVMDNLNKKARLIDDWSWVLYEDGSGHIEDSKGSNFAVSIIQHKRLRT